MKRQETASGIDHNALQEESVFLRIHQLQNGLVQLTDVCYPAVPDSLGVLPLAK